MVIRLHTSRSGSGGRGRGTALHLVGVLGPLIARERTDHQVDGSPIEFRLKIGMAIRSDVSEEFLDDLEPEFRVGHFAAADLERDLDLHVLAQEVDRVADFNPEIVRVDLRTELHLFDFVGVLMLLGFLVPFGLFVSVLAVINQATYGRHRVWRYLDKVDPQGPGHRQRLAERQDSELFSVYANYPDFAGTDLPVYPDERTGRRRITRRKRATQDTLVGWSLFMHSILSAQATTAILYNRQ